MKPRPRYLAALGPRLTLAFVVVALFAAGLTAWLGFNAAGGHFERFLNGQGQYLQAQTLQAQTFQAQSPQAQFPQARGGRGNRVGQQLLLNELRDSQLQAGALALLVAGLVGAGLAYSISRPMRNLTRVTREYSLGNRAARATVGGGSELAELGVAFNTLAGNLNAEQERERRVMADIAHELRTPLTVLRSELESMQDGLSPLTPEALGPLIAETELLGRLVNDLRLLSLAEAGELRLTRRPVNLNDLAGAVTAAFNPRAATNRVSLRLQPAPGDGAPLVVVNGDGERLRQVLHNLLENALRHTPQGGRVTVDVRQAADTAILNVTDTGPGLPEHPERLFERFYRADSARSRSDGGSGLGLAIVKAIAQAHGGSVQAANSAAGGAVFTVRLPLAPPGRSGGAELTG